MDPNGNRTNDSSFEEVRLSDFNIGPMIAKGSNSAVYSASLRVPGLYSFDLVHLKSLPCDKPFGLEPTFRK